MVVIIGIKIRKNNYRYARKHYKTCFLLFFCTCTDMAHMIHSFLGVQYHQADVELVGLASHFASTRSLARAPGTLAMYRPAWEHFVSWASIMHAPIDPSHASGPVVARYLHRFLLSQEDGIGPLLVTNASDAIHSHCIY
jgi:hypothetical protein